MLLTFPAIVALFKSELCLQLSWRMDTFFSLLSLWTTLYLLYNGFLSIVYLILNLTYPTILLDRSSILRQDHLLVSIWAWLSLGKDAIRSEAEICRTIL